MHITTMTVGGVTFLELEGEIDLAVADEVRDAGIAALTPLTSTLRIDLRGVTFMDSTGLSALIAIRNQAGDNHAVVLQNAQPSVQRVLRITGLDHVFEPRRPELSS